jgi:hypothetical protein
VRIREAETYIAEANQYQTASAAEREISAEYREQARVVQAEYFSSLREKAVARTQRSRAARRQPL